MKLKKLFVTFAIIAVFAVLSISISAGQIFNSDKEITLGIIDVDSKPIVADEFSDLTQAEIDKIVEDANVNDELVVPQDTEEVLESSSITRNAFEGTDTITTGNAQCEYRTVKTYSSTKSDVVITKIKNKKEATNLTISYQESGKNIVGIDDRACEGCTALTTVNLAESHVTSIGQSAFHGCTSLDSVTFPSDSSYLTYIGGYAFLTTPWLTYQRKHSDQALVVVNGILIDGITAKGNVTISNSGINKIAPFAFAYNSKMETLTITNDTPVAELSYRAFTGCKALKKVNLDSINIGSHAFYDCKTLEEVTLAEVENIGTAAFNKCSGITLFNFGDKIKSIDNNAFAYCKSLESVVLPDSTLSVKVGAFLNCTGLKNLVIAGKEGIDLDLSQGSFMGCTKLASVALPATTHSIDKGVFLSCPISKATLPAQFISAITTRTHLKEVEFLGTTISANALKDCPELEKITLSSTITNIGASAFEGCNLLSDVVFKGTADEWSAVTKNTNYNKKGTENSSPVYFGNILSCSDTTDKIAF